MDQLTTLSLDTIYLTSWHLIGLELSSFLQQFIVLPFMLHSLWNIVGYTLLLTSATLDPMLAFLGDQGSI